MGVVALPTHEHLVMFLPPWLKGGVRGKPLAVSLGSDRVVKEPNLMASPRRLGQGQGSNMMYVVRVALVVSRRQGSKRANRQLTDPS